MNKRQLMKSTGKNQPFCSNHRGTKAIGKCTICGKELCHNCAIIYKNKIYCISTCIPENLIKINRQVPDPGPQKKSAKVILLATITFILFGITACGLLIREINNLKQENSDLRESRKNLITTLKSNNQEMQNLHTINYKQDTPDAEFKNTEIVHTYRPHRNSSNAFTFNNGPIDKKLVALTFDGGADANIALPILDTLTSRNVKVTVFTTGEFLRKFPVVVQRFYGAGHEIGNHTFSHPHLTTYARDKTQTTLPEISKEFLYKDLVKNDNLFYSLTGHHLAKIWRAPYGEFNSTICSWAAEYGYLHVGWRQGRTWLEGLDSNDWIPNEDTPGFKTPTEVLDKILGMAQPNSQTLNGGIILMHLGSTRTNPKMQVYTILGTLIDSLQQRGYTFVTISEMVQQSGFYLASLPSNIHFQDSTIR